MELKAAIKGYQEGFSNCLEQIEINIKKDSYEPFF